MDKVNEKLGTDYKLFNYYGAPDADTRYRGYGLRSATSLRKSSTT